MSSSIFVCEPELLKRIRIGTTIVYLAKTKPDVPSVARQVAYEGKKPLDDPTTDEEGWFTLPSTSVKGTAFGTRSVEVVYSVSTTLECLPHGLMFFALSCLWRNR